MSTAVPGETPRSPLPRAALAQALATLFALASAGMLSRWLPRPLDWLELAVATGLLALPLSLCLRLPRWWLPLQLGFAPALYGASQLAIDPRFYLLAFLLTLLLLGNSVRDRVPLYLSSGAVWRRLAELLPNRAGARWLDLGCGTGGGLLQLARLRPDVTGVGVESSPLLWLLCRLRLWRQPRAQVAWADLWRVDLSGFDLVYAFLSRAPMAALWEKARAEMRPGSMLVSNGFTIPDACPSEVIELDDRHRSRLYVWRL